MPQLPAPGDTAAARWRVAAYHRREIPTAPPPSMPQLAGAEQRPSWPQAITWIQPHRCRIQAMPIHTVLGPIEASELGSTTMHEHLLSDLRLWSRPSAEAPPDGDRVHPGVLGYLRWNALSMPDNLLLEDPDEAIAELQALHAAGGRALVDLTLEGMGRRLEELPRIARESGVTICVGCGWYVEEAQP